MKNFCAAVMCCSAVAGVMVSSVYAAEGWGVDLPAALQKAQQEKKLVLVDFTGSDWCTACIKLRRSVLDTGAFREYAADKFVLMEVDLPQRADFDAELRRRNEELAERYHIGGYPTVMVLNPKGEVMGGFEGCIGEKDLVKALDTAMEAEALYAKAAMQSGVERARTLMLIYERFPVSKSFAVAYQTLRDEIMACDPANVTGIHDAEAVLQQARLFLEERNALVISNPEMGRLLERQLKEAYPANRPVIMMARCQHALATAETVEDLQTAKKMFVELIPQLPADEAAEVQHFVDTYFADPAALLQMLKRNRY